MISAETRVRRAITQVVLRHPFYGALALRLEPYEDHGVERIVADGRRLRFNPKWTMHVDGDHLITHVAGCVVRCAFSHHTRREHRDPEIWQAASSVVTHCILADSGFSMPKDIRRDFDLEHEAVETVYEAYRNQAAPDEPPQPQEPGSETSNDTDQDGDGEENAQEDGDTDQDGGKPECCEDEQGCGGVADAQDEDGERIDGDELADEENNWSVAAIQAVNIGSAAGDHIPDAFKRAVDEIKAPADDCWSILRALVSQSCERNEQTWRRPSRRYAGWPVIMPGKRSYQLGQIIVGIDTSCSIYKAILTQFFGNLQLLHEQYEPEAIKVIFGDTRHRGGPINLDRHGDFDVSQLMAAASGGGGTKLDWPFQWVDEYAEADPVCLIVLTDLEAPALTVLPPTYPVIWGVFGPDSSWRIIPAFGEIVELK